MAADTTGFAAENYLCDPSKAKQLPNHSASNPFVTPEEQKSFPGEQRLTENQKWYCSWKPLPHERQTAHKALISYFVSTVWDGEMLHRQWTKSISCIKESTLQTGSKLTPGHKEARTGEP